MELQMIHAVQALGHGGQQSRLLTVSRPIQCGNLKRTQQTSNLRRRSLTFACALLQACLLEPSPIGVGIESSNRFLRRCASQTHAVGLYQLFSLPHQGRYASQGGDTQTYADDGVTDTNRLLSSTGVLTCRPTRTCSSLPGRSLSLPSLCLSLKMCGPCRCKFSAPEQKR